jgi:2-polyprenyl-3-methyl-5-hydroxy-6-metoxy-1,4-benzoquinol methylase
MQKTEKIKEFDGAGNLFNKYESKNPLVMWMTKKYLTDLTCILIPVKAEIRSAYEIGCGEGYVTHHIHAMGIPIAGSDVSSRIIEIAKKKYPDIHFSVLSIYDVGTLPTNYDLIVANEVFEHLSHPDRAIEEVKKMTKKYILISVPHEPYFRMANIMRLKYLNDAGNTPGHINHWSKKQLKQFLVSHGLNIKSIQCSTLWTFALCEK